MVQNYILVVRDKICLFHSASDEMLKAYGCYYKSPEFSWDGTLTSADAIIDKYREQFGHMVNWSLTLVSV